MNTPRIAIVCGFILLATGCSNSASDSDASIFSPDSTVQSIVTTTAPDSTTILTPASQAPTNQGSTSASNSTTTTAKRTIQPMSLTSPDMVTGGAMPVAFTCDGQSQSPSLSWTPGPTGTVGYAIVMHHIPGPGDTHWYWVVYNIPSTTTKVAAGGPAPGTVGTNSVNNQLAYAPPCSKGPGIKVYTLTVYALSASPNFPSGTSVSRDVLLAAISNITLASSSLDVTYDRS